MISMPDVGGSAEQPSAPAASALPVLVGPACFPRCGTTLPWKSEWGPVPQVGDRLLLLPGSLNDRADVRLGALVIVGKLATLGEVVRNEDDVVEVHGLQRVSLTAQQPADLLRATWEEHDERQDDAEVTRRLVELRRLVRRHQAAGAVLWVGTVNPDHDALVLAFRIAHNLHPEAHGLRAYACPDLPSLLAFEVRLLRARWRRSGRRSRFDAPMLSGPAKGGDALEERALKAVPDELRPAVQREIDAGAEDALLEVIARFPWSPPEVAPLDPIAAQAAMDRTVAGMAAPKRAVMAVLTQDEWRRRQGLPPRGAAILLAGPPGVGKSKFGEAVAAATGRPLRRLAVGDDRDTAVRLLGSSRHFLHSDHGEIASALLDLGAAPILVVDEVDKLMQGLNGEAVLAIMLQLIDSAQNHKVIDLHLGDALPMNLSRVLWLFTANQLGAVHPALRDRCSVIELPGYSPDEKRAIIASHAWPRLLADNAIPPEALPLAEEAREAVVARHEREPGLRGVEQDLRTLMSAAVPKLLAGEVVSISLADVHRELGEPDQPSFTPDPNPPPGEALALATNGVSGQVMPIQVATVPGAGRLVVTGLASIEMEQSAGVALTYVRTHAAGLGLSAAEVNSLDYHVHLPGGGIVKHGPSAGLALAVALYSRLTGKPVPGSAAMTGEVDLQGGVRGVGGVLAKLGAARQAGLGMVLVPASVETDDPLAVRVLSVAEGLEKLGLLTVRASGGSADPPRSPTRRAARSYQRRPAHLARAVDPAP